MTKGTASLQEYLRSLPEWQDDMKARSMFASFNQPRDVNPEAWDARFGFWKGVILEATELGLLSDSIFTVKNVDELSFMFCRNHISPLGLSEVITGMRQRGILVPLEEVEQKSRRPLSELFIWGPLRASWGWAMGSSQGDEVHHQMACPSILQKWSDLVIRRVTGSAQSNIFSAFFTQESLAELLCSLRAAEGHKANVSQEDTGLLIKYMKSKGHLAIFDGKDASIIRVRLVGEKGPIRITEEQRNYVKLRSSTQRLSEYITGLDKRIQEIRGRVLVALREKNRPVAMQHLKQSKELEKIRLDRMNCLVSLESILIKIENSHSDAEVFEAYRIGEKTLRSMVSALPDVSTIDDLMGALHETITDQEQISQAMAQPTASFEDEDELLAELAMLSLPDTTTSPVRSPLEDRDVSRLRDDMSHLVLQTPPPDKQQEEDTRTALLY